jgi:peptidoglycan/xylan/chitin deacetylase (PgdA/CDA1 family)
MIRTHRELLAWGLPAAVVLAISLALTLRQAGFARGPEPARFSGGSVVLGMPSLLAPAQLPSRVPVAIVRDAAAADFYESPATLDTILRAWRDALAAIGADARIVSSAQLNRAAARVIVVPSSPCLTIATREAIERAGARGLGVIVTGAAGTFDAGCRPLGYGFLVALTGASRAHLIRDRTTINIAIPHGGPLSADVPPGARIGVHPAMQLALRGPPRDAIYAGYDLRPAPADGSPLLDAAITHGSYRTARVVYWGFELRDIVDTPWNRGIAALLVRNSVAWAGALPFAVVEPWPGNRRTAVVLAQDVEESFANARYAADSLQAIGVPGTFFLASDIARRHRRLARELPRTGEVASHSGQHELLGGLPPEEQHARLLATQRDLTALLGAPVTGLRPPEEQFDHATMQGWLAAGGTYLFGANDARTVAPELLQVGTDTIILLPRTGADDIAAMRRSARDARTAAARFSDDFAHVRALGGLYTLSYHSHLLARREHVPLLARLARTFASDTTVWIATAADVAQWWQARAQIEATVRVRGASRLDLTVRNRGTEAVRGAVIRVSLPASRRAIRSAAQLLAADAGFARVLIPDLEAGAERTVSLTLAGM